MVLITRVQKPAVRHSLMYKLKYEDIKKFGTSDTVQVDNVYNSH